MLVRILVFAFAIVLLGGSIANAEPQVATDTIELTELLDVDAIAAPQVVTAVEPVRQLLTPIPPPLAAVSPRLHVSSLFRPPRT